MTFVGQLHGFQEEAVEFMTEVKKVLVAYEMGLGKDQPLTSRVLTPTGWVTMGDIRVGDEVIGSDGKPKRVLAVFPQGERAVYKVSFSDGAVVECGEEHLWAVNTPTRRHRGNLHRVLTLRQIMDEGLTYANGNKRHFVPLVAPVQFAHEQPLPLDPYLLGLLLGDGHLKYGRVHFSTADAQVIHEVVAALPDGAVVRHLSNYDWAILGAEHRGNPVLNAVRVLDLGERGSADKFIPTIYKFADVSSREALLQGLLDSDGHVRPDNNVEYCTVSPRLAADVVELVQSLGGVTRIRTKKTKTGVAYRMSVQLPEEIRPFRVHRKAIGYRVRSKYPPHRAIIDVRYVGNVPTQCVLIDSPDHLYVTDDYVLTHNTVITIAAIESLRAAGEVSSGLVIVLASLKYQWQRQIEKFAPGAKSIVIDGTPKKRERQYQEAMSGDYTYIILNYEQIVNDWKIVRCLPRDYVVCDEVTAIKSFRAKRARKVKRLDAPYKYGLTGQPIENRAEEAYSIMQWVEPDLLGRFDLFDKTFIVRNHFGGVKRYRNLPTLHKRLSAHMVRKTRDDSDVADQMPKVSEQSRLIEFDASGASLYRYICKALAADLDRAAEMGMGFDLWAHYHGDDTSENEMRGQIMSKMTCLRMLCDHPDLLRLSAKRFGSTAIQGTAGGSVYAHALLESGRLAPLTRAPKLNATLELLDEILEADERNKIVLFSFFKPTLRFIADATKETTRSVQFTGNMSARERDVAKVQFDEDPQTRLFLSSDAGGYGVDLPAANYLINYDLPWSAGKLEQRNARIIRLSTEWDKVTLINMLMAGSIEERQYDMLTEKKRVASAIVDGKGIDQKGRLELTIGTLRRFLEESAV